VTTCHRSGIKFKDTQLPDPPWTWVEIELEYIIHGKIYEKRKSNDRPLGQ